jgi:predicted AAA+ superfamily ATPase
MIRSHYVQRHLEKQLWEYVQQFPVVLLLGARQVGKTTFLSHELDQWTHLDLEDPGTADRIRSDPALFLRDHPDQVWFDEAHRCPSLFPALRVAIDRDRRPGRYVLSGSATGQLITDVSESLAGRTGVLQLHPLSLAERMERVPSQLIQCLVEAEESDDLRSWAEQQETSDYQAISPAWFFGGYPEPWLYDDTVRWRRWFDSYLRLVSERDLARVHPDLTPVTVRRLLRMLAARQGQLVNLSELATNFGVSTQKLRRYLDLLEGTYLWQRLDAYSVNIGKRVTKSPKGWLTDPGLLHALLDLRGPEDLEVHPMIGHSWEGWLIKELMLQADLSEETPSFYHWRTSNQAEVDLVVEHRGRLIPVEMKRGTQIKPYSIRGLKSFLESFGPDVAPFGVVLYGGDDVWRISDSIVAIPASRAL